MYAAREIVVFLSDGKTEFTRFQIGPTGVFQEELPVGVYVIDINHLGIDYAEGLPVQIEIRENVVTRLNIDIDTGIR